MKFKIIISIDGVEKDFWTAGILELVHKAIDNHQAFKAPKIEAIRDKSVISIKLHSWKKTGDMQ